MTSICKVKNCRHGEHHVTKRHCCGKCLRYGHGQIECEDTILIDRLKEYDNDRMLINCNVKDCIDPATHSTKGHGCRFCNKKSKHLLRCPKNGINICDPFEEIPDFHRSILLETTNNMTLQNGQYSYVYAGMGCVWYIRKTMDNYEYFFLHTDSMGQYGEDTSDIPRLNAFTFEYTLVNPNLG
jgi:hypothetical protein